MPISGAFARTRSLL
ncbi:hypothetical protein LINGRAHAP2_LOCUS8664 [Linum grandiflorum]